MPRHRLSSGRMVRAALALATAIGCGLAPAMADDLKIRGPIIEPRELEFENNEVLGGNGAKTSVHEIEYGFNDWLKLGVEGELAANPGQGFHFDASAVEGFLQLTPQGKYWADIGLFGEFENTALSGDARNITFGPLVTKEATLFRLDTVHTINLLFTKGVGAWSIGPPTLRAAAQSRIRLDPHFEPGIEYYGIVTLGTHGEEPTHRAGPAFAGRVGFRELGINAPGGIRYDAAYLRGLTGATEPDTFRLRVEFEFPL